MTLFKRCVMLLGFRLILMAKGYWLVTTTVTNAAFKDYVDAFATWIESVDGIVFAKDMKSKTVEGKGGPLAVIIEFPSKEAALLAYESTKYQELSKLRWANSSDTNITIMDGAVTH